MSRRVGAPTLSQLRTISFMNGLKIANYQLFIKTVNTERVSGFRDPNLK